MRHAYFSVVLLVSLALPGVVACGDDDASSPGPGASGTSGGSSGAAPGEASITSCPVQTSLIEGVEWVSCVAGKSFKGTEPFNNQACELRFDADGGVTYLRAGAETLTAKRSSWGATAYGSFQNRGEGGARFFLASVNPELPALEGQPRMIRFKADIRGSLAGESKVEVEYVDAALARQTYNCKVTGP